MAACAAFAIFTAPFADTYQIAVTDVILETSHVVAFHAPKYSPLGRRCEPGPGRHPVADRLWQPQLLPRSPAKVQTAEQLYKIGAMDVLNIVVWRNPELSANITVRPDGRISLPLVEDLQAAGRNPADLSRDIEKL